MSRASNLRKIGWTEYEYLRQLDIQDNKCAICGEEETYQSGRNRLSADHDHITGIRRELLCARCNLALGAVNDDPDLLDKMAQYLRRHGRW